MDDWLGRTTALTVPVFAAVHVPGGGVFTLDGPEGRHAASVRRLRVGERLDVTDGAGAVAECVVAVLRREALDCQVLARRVVPAPSPRLVVVQALPKGDRGERAVEMLTEVGADVVVPWSASRSVVRWDGERGRKSQRRWASTAVEAAKQSRRTHWPVVTELASTEAVAARISAAEIALVLHEDAVEPLTAVPRELMCGRSATSDPFASGAGESGETGAAGEPGTTGATAEPRAVGDIVVVVGPEGSLAADEIDAFVAAGARVVRLGPTVLRTSTAGVVAATLVLAATGRLGVTAPPVGTAGG